MEIAQRERQRGLLWSVIAGVALGAIGIALFVHFDEDLCGTSAQILQTRVAWTLVVFGPLVGCFAFPLFWRRRPEVRPVAGFWVGAASFVLGGIVWAVWDEALELSDPEVSLVVPFVVWFVWRARRPPEPGQLRGYLLGFTTGLAIMLSLITYFLETCS
ncbi:MAG: hypothetical protein WD598_03575 [Acidimicrobiia bacterium]